MRERVGASIVEIITESLYDKPIVVFREYVQNSADAIRAAKKSGCTSELTIKIWEKENFLYFLDNGTGIEPNDFASKMSSIADSAKIKSENIGYKGIGRLSGLSYCQKLIFVNIIDYNRAQFQTYTIDCHKYAQLKKSRELNAMQFSDLMQQIATYDDSPNDSEFMEALEANVSMFKEQERGFLVILEHLSPILSNTIKEPRFLDNLGWLLPVPFRDELLSPIENNGWHELFLDLSNMPAFQSAPNIPAEAFHVFYDEKPIQRPITRKLIRKLLCQSNMEEYAVCVHTFSDSGIAINNANPFSGIRIYYDNTLLCDESELIPALKQFGLLPHTINETIQAVRGIGAVVYIVDKVNITTNARRTFIDVTNGDAIEFLKLMSEFVENIFQARYALSHYFTAKKKEEITSESLEAYRVKAENALIRLARQAIVLDDSPELPSSFSELETTEQRRIIKAKLSKKFNDRIKRYVALTMEFDLDTYYNDFLAWLSANDKV